MSQDLQKELSEIFVKACKVMKKKLENPEEVTAADLNAILGFLKHNQITAIPVKGSPLGELVEALDQSRNTIPFPFPVNSGDILSEDDPAVSRKAAESP